jgi:hypothetical protein
LKTHGKSLSRFRSCTSTSGAGATETRRKRAETGNFSRDIDHNNQRPRDESNNIFYKL